MENTRAARVEAEIEKVRAKIISWQARLKELEAKRTEIENAEIVDAVRGMSIPLDELPNLLQSIKGASGQNVPKSTDTKKESETEEIPK